MIDIHSHILPGLDDGPRTLAEAVAMVHMAVAAGTSEMVASPHANQQFDYSPEAVDEKIRELEQAAGGVLRIHRGCDFHLSISNIQDALEHPTRYTIGGKRYLLVEFPELMTPPSADGIFERFRQVGITPIITHPERHALLRRHVSSLENWIAGGALVQITAQSWLGRFGVPARRSAEALMNRGLIHFVASDGHGVEDRPPVLDEAYRAIAAGYGEPAAKTLFTDNPAAALSGGEVIKLKPVEAKKTGKLLQRIAGSWWR